MSTITDYDDVTQYGLDNDVREEILRKQIECTFIWGPKNHWAVGVLMTYLWKDGSFWVSATSQRKRIAAIKRDPRVSVVVSSHGTDLGPREGDHRKGSCHHPRRSGDEGLVLPRVRCCEHSDRGQVAGRLRDDDGHGAAPRHRSGSREVDHLRRGEDDGGLDSGLAPENQFSSSQMELSKQEMKMMNYLATIAW